MANKTSILSTILFGALLASCGSGNTVEPSPTSAPAGLLGGAASPGPTQPPATPTTAPPTVAPTSPPTATAVPPTATTVPPTPIPPKPAATPTTAPEPYYANCDAVRAAGKAPLYRGQAGYRAALDRDNDGVACE